jgi:hypothetical protein
VVASVAVVVAVADMMALLPEFAPVILNSHRWAK